MKNLIALIILFLAAISIKTFLIREGITNPNEANTASNSTANVTANASANATANATVNTSGSSIESIAKELGLVSFKTFSDAVSERLGVVVGAKDYIDAYKEVIKAQKLSS